MPELASPSGEPKIGGMPNPFAEPKPVSTIPFIQNVLGKGNLATPEVEALAGLDQQLQGKTFGKNSQEIRGAISDYNVMAKNRGFNLVGDGYIDPNRPQVMSNPAVNPLDAYKPITIPEEIVKTDSNIVAEPVPIDNGAIGIPVNEVPIDNGAVVKVLPKQITYGEYANLKWGREALGEGIFPAVMMDMPTPEEIEQWRKERESVPTPKTTEPGGPPQTIDNGGIGTEVPPGTILPAPPKGSMPNYFPDTQTAEDWWKANAIDFFDAEQNMDAKVTMLGNNRAQILYPDGSMQYVNTPIPIVPPGADPALYADTFGPGGALVPEGVMIDIETGRRQWAPGYGPNKAITEPGGPPQTKNDFMPGMPIDNLPKSNPISPLLRGILDKTSDRDEQIALVLLNDKLAGKSIGTPEGYQQIKQLIGDYNAEAKVKGYALVGDGYTSPHLKGAGIDSDGNTYFVIDETSGLMSVRPGNYEDYFTPAEIARIKADEKAYNDQVAATVAASGHGMGVPYNPSSEIKKILLEREIPREKVPRSTLRIPPPKTDTDIAKAFTPEEIANIEANKKMQTDLKVDSHIAGYLMNDPISWSSGDFDVVGDGVRLIVEANSGQKEAVLAELAALGIPVETSYGDQIQALIPKDLISKVGSANVRNITSPVKPVSGPYIPREKEMIPREYDPVRDLTPEELDWLNKAQERHYAPGGNYGVAFDRKDVAADIIARRTPVITPMPAPPDNTRPWNGEMMGVFADGPQGGSQTMYKWNPPVVDMGVVAQMQRAVTGLESNPYQWTAKDVEEAKQAILGLGSAESYSPYTLDRRYEGEPLTTQDKITLQYLKGKGIGTPEGYQAISKILQEETLPRSTPVVKDEWQPAKNEVIREYNPTVSSSSSIPNTTPVVGLTQTITTATTPKAVLIDNGARGIEVKSPWVNPFFNRKAPVATKPTSTSLDYILKPQSELRKYPSKLAVTPEPVVKTPPAKAKYVNPFFNRPNPVTTRPGIRKV